MKNYANRNEVPEKYRLNLQEYFKNEEEWEENWQKTQASLPDTAKYQGKLKDATILEKYLKEYFLLGNTIEDLYVYAYISLDLDLKDEKKKEMKNKAISLMYEFEQINSFLQPEIVNMERKNYHNLFKENKNLKPYQKFLDLIYEEKEHTLSEKEEKIMNSLVETYSSYASISSTLINSDHNYGKIKLNDGNTLEIASNNIRSLKRSKDPKVRKGAAQKFGKVLLQYQNTESSLLHYYVKNNCNLAKLKNFPSAWQRKLHQIKISNEVFENLKRVAKQKKNVYQEYYQLIKQILKTQTLHNYDALLEWNQKETNYSIEEAEKIISEALKPLGENYQAKLQKVFKNHYIDYCSYKGKVSGAYSFGTSNQNSRIVLSYTGQYNDILTVAHEAGHNVHHQYINENNPSWYRNTSSFVAEVASLTNEFLVNHYMLTHFQDKEIQLMGIEHTIKTFQNNFFSAIQEADVEQKMYEHVENGQMITATYLNDLTLKSLKEYRGTIVKNDPYTKLNWVTRSHYFMNFYLYSYALCASIAASLAMRIINEEPNIISKYEEFLKCGSDCSPEEIYSKLGINIKEEKVFENAVDFFSYQLDKYEEISKGGIRNE